MRDKGHKAANEYLTNLPQPSVTCRIANKTVDMITLDPGEDNHLSRLTECQDIKLMMMLTVKRSCW